jgi:hypothetical protein
MTELVVHLEPWTPVAFESLDGYEDQGPVAIVRLPVDINETEARLICEVIMSRAAQSEETS